MFGGHLQPMEKNKTKERPNTPFSFPGNNFSVPLILNGNSSDYLFSPVVFSKCNESHELLLHISRMNEMS